MMQIIKAVIIAVAVPAVAAVKPADANAAKSTRRGKLPKLGGGIGRTKTEKTGALAKLRKTAQTPWWNPSNVDNVHQVVQRSGMTSGFDEIGPSHPGLTRRYLPTMTKPQADDASAANGPPGDSGNGSA